MGKMIRLITYAEIIKNKKLTDEKTNKKRHDTDPAGDCHCGSPLSSAAEGAGEK